MSQIELGIHVTELIVLVFGIAGPTIWTALRLRAVFQDFPPHRHINGPTGKIMYPKGYEPGELD